MLMSIPSIPTLLVGRSASLRHRKIHDVEWKQSSPKKELWHDLKSCICVKTESPGSSIDIESEGELGTVPAESQSRQGRGRTCAYPIVLFAFVSQAS